jgi:hypothetical protein
MDQSTLRDSTKYPPGYGDFALQCSDNIVCYFPRHLLEYMSPVFKDMFSLAAEAIDSHSRTQSSQPPLKLTESSAVIEALLEHIDPKSKRVLPIYPDIILGLLDAAQKYQISTVIEWFAEQGCLHHEETTSGEVVGPFTSTHPALALECALQFELPHIGKLALRELASAPSSKIQLGGTDLPSRVYKHQCHLREARVKRYRGYISQISAALNVKCLSGKPCSKCLGILCIWVLTMERAVVDRPGWQSFLEAYETGGACGRCGLKARDHFPEYPQKWEQEAKKAEDELPEWPF